VRKIEKTKTQKTETERDRDMTESEADRDMTESEADRDMTESEADRDCLGRDSRPRVPVLSRSRYMPIGTSHTHSNYQYLFTKHFQQLTLTRKGKKILKKIIII
jgi:hypothetical protein